MEERQCKTEETRKVQINWMADITQPHAFVSTLGDESSKGKKKDEESGGTPILVEEIQTTKQVMLDTIEASFRR